jgi:hypothetical protein
MKKKTVFGGYHAQGLNQVGNNFLLEGPENQFI